MNAHVLWYATRATGIVSLLLLTGTTVVGVLTSVRLGTRAWPRFAWQDLHRRLSLVAVVFVGLHVASTVLDGYAPIGWLSAFVPFTSPYRRLWLGLGTVAVDLLLAVGISSVLRARIRPATWRALHWLAYASWPLAVVHGLGTGTDPRLHWVLGLVVCCTATVLGAVAWRLWNGWPRRRAVRIGAGALSAVVLAGLAAWASSGPLRPGWAARAGTPRSLLGRTVAASAPASASGSTGGATTATGPGGGSSSGAPAAATASLPSPPYEVSLAGSISERAVAGGLSEVDISARTSGTTDAVLGIRLVGAPDANGGIVMQRGSATFGPPAAPTRYEGTVVGLEGARLALALTDAAGRTLDLRVDLSLRGGAVTGTLAAVTGLGSGDDAGAGDGSQ